MIYMTSDLHFSHARICALADRPYGSVQEMNQSYVQSWNETVLPEDTVYVLGDYAMGRIDDSLALTRRLLGTKILVSGNHDKTFAGFWSANKAHRRDEFHEAYLDAGFNFIYPGDVGVSITLSDQEFVMSHFPFAGDHTEKERYLEYRPEDTGVPLIHGHVHSHWKYSVSSKGTAQIHVGIDAWGRPVSETEILDVLKESS